MLNLKPHWSVYVVCMSPTNLLPYEKYVEWKQAKSFKEYDYRKMFKEGVSKPREILLQQK